ncbi:EAL domain-containing protein [Enterobacter sp.]|uniref:EAL domain-containing protein n=1 Tax=Enterobacter sp. TaxID=42895 RepID=UPI00296F974F|nr:EAL domain-containing protein [Enterobacter sp.]
MIVTLDNTWRSELLLLPARNEQSLLQGVEVIVNFSGDDSSVRTPTELMLPRLTDSDTLTLFTEQLALIDACKLFFIQHQLCAWININPVIVDALLTNPELAACVERFPFLEFTINENYPDLNKGKENIQLAQLAQRYCLVLANFGAGEVSSRAVFDGLFHRIAIDKHFLHHQLSSLAFDPFMRAIVSQVSPHCRSLMISGVDSEQILQRLLPFQFSAMQGSLWPPVTPAAITTLVQ